MAEHRGGHALHVLGNDVVAAAQQRVALGSTHQRNRRAGARAEREIRRIARGGADGGDIGAHLGRGIGALHLLLHGEHVLRGADGGERLHGRGRAAVAREDVHLVLHGRIADGNAHEEAVHLRLRQRIGAYEIDRILRGEHHERAGERIGDAVDGDLPLLHDLKQRALRLGRGAVDLVGEDDLREDRARAVLHLARDAGHRIAGDVRRGDVGRELNALERAGQRAGER